MVLAVTTGLRAPGYPPSKGNSNPSSPFQGSLFLPATLRVEHEGCMVAQVQAAQSKPGSTCVMTLLWMCEGWGGGQLLLTWDPSRLPY